jgi:hypothetical protein
MFARRVHASLVSDNPQIDEIQIRLYGGWYDLQGLTQRGTQLAQEIASSFPLLFASNRRISCRVFCEIASALAVAPADLLLHTFRKRSGMRSRLTISPNVNCANPASCTLNAVAAWSMRQGICPQAGCMVTARDAFLFDEQKLVDTLLCCDILTFASGPSSSPVYVASDDDDLIPALLLGSKQGGRVRILKERTRVRQTAYAPLLSQYNVHEILL